MLAANDFRGVSLGDSTISSMVGSEARGAQRSQSFQQPRLEVVLDIEQRDWDFKVEAGM